MISKKKKKIANITDYTGTTKESNSRSNFLGCYKKIIKSLFSIAVMVFGIIIVMKEENYRACIYCLLSAILLFPVSNRKINQSLPVYAKLTRGHFATITGILFFMLAGMTLK